MSTVADWLGNVRIGVVGLGYVGLPLAVELGKRFPVTGFDTNLERIAALQRGDDATLEVSPGEISAADRLVFSSSTEDLAACNVYIVTVPTPIDTHNRPDLGPLLKASETVGAVLAEGDTVIYESTVYPGCTEEECVPVLEARSGLRFHDQFAVGYPRPALPASGLLSTKSATRRGLCAGSPRKHRATGRR